MRFFVFLIIYVALALPLAKGQLYSNEFLSIGVGARAHGMGLAQTAHIDDVTAAYWNPAGLTGMGKDSNTNLQLAGMHAEWFGGIGKYDYIGLGLPLAQQGHYLAFSFIRFGVDGIPNTLSLYNTDGTINYDNITEFSAADYAFMGAYARELKDLGLSWGLNAKVVHRSIGPFAKSWGFGADAGLQYRKGAWSHGLMIRDITTTYNAWRFSFTEAERQVLQLTGNEVPIQSVELTRPQIQLGTAYARDFATKRVNRQEQAITWGLLAALDFNMNTDGQRNVLFSGRRVGLAPVLGLEAHYARTVFLRLGLNNVQRFGQIDGSQIWTMQPNFGVGLRFKRFQVDYALANLSGSAGVLVSHLVSAKIDLNYDYLRNLTRTMD